MSEAVTKFEVDMTLGKHKKAPAELESDVIWFRRAMILHFYRRLVIYTVRNDGS